VSLVCQCRLPLSTHTLNYLSDLLRRRLKAIRSRWRVLPPGRIAVIVLAVLRHDQRLADMAGGNDISATTIRRWRDELPPAATISWPTCALPVSAAWPTWAFSAWTTGTIRGRHRLQGHPCPQARTR
jgi:hypothetical protein